MVAWSVDAESLNIGLRGPLMLTEGKSMII